MKKLIKKILRSLAGKKKFQKLFEGLYRISLHGMNIGGEDTSAEVSGEKMVMDYVQRKMKDKQHIVIFDVGANVGHYTMMLDQFFTLNKTIYAFEPSKKTYQKFLENTAHVRGLQHFNFGFGKLNEKITLYSNADESGLASLYNRKLDHFGIQMNNTENVELRTIDDFCLENGISKINFLKIDVEGHEIKVLEGAKEMMNKKAIDYIQFEFGGCNIDSRTFFQDFYYLLKDNYQIYRIVKDGLHRIEGYKEMYEAFIMTNYLAERIK